MFRGVDMGAGLLGAAAARLSKAAFISMYCSVVVAASWSSAAWLLVAANARSGRLAAQEFPASSSPGRGSGGRGQGGCHGTAALIPRYQTFQIGMRT